MSTHKKQDLVDAVRKSFGKVFPEFKGKEHRCCLQVSLITGGVAAMMGIRTALVAGSAKWRILSDVQQGEALLNGENPMSTFAYQFEAHEAIMTMVDNAMPEMHCWNQTESGEIIDLTVGGQMKQFEELIGEKWPGDPLPDYLWDTRDNIRADGHDYIADPAATQLAHQLGAIVNSDRIRRMIEGSLR